jgi:Tol biopolymer transport system component
MNCIFLPKAIHPGHKVSAYVRLALVILLSVMCLPGTSKSAQKPDAEISGSEPGIRRMTPCVTTIAPAPDGIVAWSPDNTQYLLNKTDASGIYQIYVGTAAGNAVCVSCTQVPNGPAPSLHKLEPRWHSSGQWIVLAVEIANQSSALSPAQILGLLESGIGVNIFAMRPDGSQWYQLSDFGPSQPADGFTGVAFTPNGTQGVWAQILNGNYPGYLFGKWQLILADFQVSSQGVPAFTNLQDITPATANWIEPGNFAPDGRSLLLTSDIGMSDPQGMDQFILDITTGAVRNLTNSPTIWDEHGLFSSDGSNIVFMSSYPFRSNPLASTVLFLETEFMMMDIDGGNLRQLTHFNTPGYPESNMPPQRTVAAVAAWNLNGTSLSALNLIFPDYQTWSIDFQGGCLNGVRRSDAGGFQN